MFLQVFFAKTVPLAFASALWYNFTVYERRCAMASLTIILFCLCLFICLVFRLSVLYALIAGLVLFIVYALRSGHSFANALKYAFFGIRDAKNVLIAFLLIGIMTALWREAGTIPTIVCYLSRLVHPSVFLLMTFILNCLISVLTGTSFGTAATMGAICSTMAASLGISPVLMGGAVLSGAFFGDRCSPVSTSALLVADLTKTSIFSNIKGMLRTALLPFFLTSLIYVAIGLKTVGGGELPDLFATFGEEFHLSLLAVIPAAVILILSLFKVNVKISMSASIISTIPICLFVQNTPIKDITQTMIFGYRADSAQIAEMLNGGGILSMINVSAIVCISAAYSGIFKKTDILVSIKKAIHKLAARSTPYIAILATSIVSAVISCNQTLAIMLTEQLCHDIEKDRNKLALALENTAVVIAPLVPWSIAGAVPLASVNAPLSSIAFAFFLYLVPLCNIFAKKDLK